LRYSCTLSVTSALDAGGWSTCSGRFISGKETRYPFSQEAMWAPELVLTGVKSFIPAGIRCPKRPLFSESLCRLSHPSPHIFTFNIIKFLPQARQKKRHQKKQEKIGWKMFIQTHSLAALDFACSKQEFDKLLRRYERCSSETKIPIASHVSN